jgi:hypothetical protein
MKSPAQQSVAGLARGESDEWFLCAINRTMAQLARALDRIDEIGHELEMSVASIDHPSPADGRQHAESPSNGKH